MVKLPNKEVMEIMRPIADNKVAPQQGWEFKLQQDSEFLSRYGGGGLGVGIGSSAKV